MQPERSNDSQHAHQSAQQAENPGNLNLVDRRGDFSVHWS